MFEKICELADKFDADASTMTMDTKIKEDPNVTLDVVELMMDWRRTAALPFPMRKRPR